MDKYYVPVKLEWLQLIHIDIRIPQWIRRMEGQ